MIIMNSINFEETAHKLMLLKLNKNEQDIIADVVVETSLR